MKGRLTKLITFFMIFLLCFNIYNFLSMPINNEKVAGIKDQTSSFLTTSNGADPLTLKIGTSSGPNTLELVDAWDSASNDVLEQVVETMFFYDLTDENLPRINLLAETFYWADTTHLQIKLRETILFHDGTPFNAAAAKWNLDRLLYLTNCTGTNTGTVAQTRSLWMFPDGETPIINNVVTVGEYNITIILNGAYTPLLNTLSYINAGMISPSAHTAEATSFIDLITGHPVGTGPFTYDYYDPDIEVKFNRWDNYWRGAAYFEDMVFVLFADVTTAHNAFLSYTIDWNRMYADQNLALYDADPNIKVKRFTDDTGRPSLVYHYMGFNNEKYNTTWRRAMAHAINYSHVIEVLRLGNAFRAVSAISPGFGGAHNASVVGPDFDITEARILMQSMGFGVGFTTDAQWITVAEGSSPFLSLPYTYNVGNSFREDFLVVVTEWFKLIGINVVDDGVTFSEFLGYLYDDYDHLGIFVIGWGPDFLDPYNMLDPLFNPTSSSNSAQVNDIKLSAMMASALAETDESARNNIYQNIQSYLARMQFHAPLYHPKVTYVHLNEIKRIPYNAMNSLYTYPIYRTTPRSSSTLMVGIGYGSSTLEPVDCWDSNSKDVLDQVVETLFTYDLSDPELPQINQLAENYWWEDTTTLHISLRRDILFHDYTPFNAAAAKWNLDRLLYLTNCTGTNTNQVAQTRSLWLLPDGDIPIIASVSTVGDWNITITLNAPYAPLLHLLSYINAGMLSPSSTPATEFIDTLSGQVVATGPFMLEHYDPNIEVKFNRWDNYWKGPAYFEDLVFVIFDDITTAHDAMLAHEIDILNIIAPQYIPEYEADPNVMVKRFTDDTGKPGLAYYYLGFNNQKYNQTWRKIMSHAINYTYIIDILLQGSVIRANSPISPGFGLGYNESATAANFDITEARALMQSMGYGVGFTTDQEWIDQANFDPFLSVPYTYNIGNQIREDLYVALHEWYKLVGIQVVEEAVYWSEFLTYIYEDPDHLGLFFLGWGPDYLEPFNILYPLVSSGYIWNTARIDDPYLDDQLALALETNDDTVRYSIYKDIQSYFAEVGYFHAPLYHKILNFVHLNEIQGIPYNALEDFYAYPIYRAIPGQLSLSSDAESPDTDGDFTLYWTMADRANNYTVYQSSSFIDTLTGIETMIAEEINDLSLFLSGYPDGSYYFIIAATNEHGYTLSNCINVVVQITDDHDLEVNLNIPTGIEIGTSNIITATVRNIGLNDEVDVELYLYLDDVLVDSIIIPYLPVGDIGVIQYDWTPTEYDTYTFKAYTVPVPGEISQDDNMIIVDVPLLDTQIFDGLFIDYIFDQMGYALNSTFIYTPYQDGLFYETWIFDIMGTYEWMVDPMTRLMSNGSVFGDGAHTPIWIFTDVSLGDTIPIAVDGEGDHLFNVTGELLYDLQGFGTVGVWVLNDLAYPGTVAWYEKSTGILLDGLFYYFDGMYNFTLEFMNTNAQFEYGANPGPFILSSDADDPDEDGSFTLSWTESEEADSYSIYQHSSFITEITGELILLADGITDLELVLDGYPDGTYYFIVVAHNEYGDTLSNCIQVVVDIPVPPSVIYDTIPDEIILTYTRNSQILGSISAYSSSQIIFVGWVGEVDPGFALFTTYTEDENGGIYISETTISTTYQLETGVHLLNLRIWNAEGDYYDKIISVIVYRQAELNLRGEFDYLLREEVKISVVAQAFDVEDQFLLNPITLEGMIIHVKITDYDGNVKVEDIMTYNPDGFFQWDSVQTIKQLKDIFPKGIYIVQAWIEFPSESYYLGGNDVIEFHIDPPAEDEVGVWFFIEIFGFGGLIAVVLTLTILLKRKRGIE
ncbi:MAG: hypothetical protein KGD73_10835 [Candidatus Lokiarchaeota archaeon]|nr:hypothetical protein [Candidatus Lokiarchaeota archaeon]